MSKQIALSDKRRSMIFVNILICCVAGSMLATALNTALPPIMKDFQIEATTGQWLTSGYSLAMAIIMPLTAYLINRFPTKRLYCISIAVFVVGLVMRKENGLDPYRYLTWALAEASRRPAAELVPWKYI